MDLQVSLPVCMCARSPDDVQAISRSHRYGQTKPVLVFKLMTENSVEGE